MRDQLCTEKIVKILQANKLICLKGSYTMLKELNLEIKHVHCAKIVCIQTHYKLPSNFQ